jgi:hypothetical protein
MAEKNQTTLQLKGLVKNILEDPDNDQSVILNINNIHNIFKELNSISGNDQSIANLAAVPTARGKALGLNHAANCLLDYRRTVLFLQAMIATINQKRQENPGATINIFYAGCGPYAPFLCMIAPMFDPSEVQFSILEINPISLEAAKELILALDLNAYLKESHLADAVTFKVPNAQSYHILYSETLDAVLFRECFVPILFNLLPQFSDDVALIPENVIVDLKFIKITKDKDGSEMINETPVDVLVDARAAVASRQDPTKIPAQLPTVTANLNNMERYDLIVIDTTVVVSKNIILERGQSSLTLPLEFTLEQPFKDSKMVFTYHLEPEIELKYQLIPLEN